MKKTRHEEWKETVVKKLQSKKRIWIKQEIVLFGISEATQVAFNFIINNGGNVSFIVDNDPMQRERTWMGRKVFSPEILKTIHKTVYVIICGGFWYEKKAQLQENGVVPKNILVIKGKGSLFFNVRDLVIAWNIYKKLREKYGEQLLLCPYPGTGDAYLTGRYLQNYIRENGLDRQFTILVAGKVFEKVMRMYGYTNVVTISQYECDKLKKLITCLGDNMPQMHYMLYWGLDYQNTYHIENYRNISFAEIFEKTVFGTGEKQVSLPQFTTDEQEIQKIMDQYQIREKQTVVLAPYVNSFMDELPIEWWEDLVSKLNEAGYKVFTNSSSEKEMIIPGTEKIFLTYQDMYPILERCGYFIAVRSGLCDLMSGASCKKIIIYQDYISNERMNFFSLNNMKLCSDAIEIKLDNSEKGKQMLLRAILNEMKQDMEESIG